MTPLVLAGLLLDPQALSKLLDLPLTERPSPKAHRPASPLQLTLHGTLVCERYALALVSAPTRTVTVGSRLGSPTVVAIDRACITFDDDTELCRGPREPSAAAAAPAAPGVHVKLTDFAEWTQVRIVPVPGGFKVFGVVAGSIYEKLGVQNGDVLRKVNGRPVDFTTVSLIKPGQELSVELERKGAPYVLTGQLD